MGNSIVRVNGKLYEVLKSLGEGGFAHVYEVKRDNRHFALKWTRSVTEDDDLQRLLLEIQVQRKLQHPNVLRLEAAEVRRSQAVNGHNPIVKEALMLSPLITHGSLQTFLEETASRGTAAFTEISSLHFFAKLVSAVMALHDLGFTHRDIKPGNVLLLERETMLEPLLMDFGSVAPLKVQVKGQMECTKLWEDAARYSSAAYRAPELWNSGNQKVEVVDGRTDVWSLGCVLYAMAFGPFSPFEHPRDGVQHLAIVNGYVSFPHGNMGFGQVYSATFTALIMWILTPDVAERPNLEGVSRCLHQLLNPPPYKQPSVKIVRSFSRSHRLSAEGTNSYQETRNDEQDWADFSTFENPRSLSSEVSFSASRSSSAALKPSHTITTRPKQTSVIAMDNGSTLATDDSRDRERRDPNLRRVLSYTGKRLWVGALEDA